MAISVFALSLFVCLQIKVQAQVWSELGGLNGLAANNDIYTICSDKSGNIYAAGIFTDSLGSNYVAKYNDNAWSEESGLYGSPFDGAIYSICADSSENIYAAGLFLDDIWYDYIGVYNGTAWAELFGSDPYSYYPFQDLITQSVCSDKSGNIYAAAYYYEDTSVDYFVGKFNGTKWSELRDLKGAAAHLAINSKYGYGNTIYTDASGNIYETGKFTNDSGFYYVAKYQDTTWSELGSQNSLTVNGPISGICSDVDGNIYAAGSFINASGKYYVAKYNGTTWSELGGLNALAANGPIQSICSDVLGNIYAAGNFTNPAGRYYVAKYNGTTWSELGGVNGLAADSNILTIQSDASGNIYAAGQFTNPSGNRYVAKYGAITDSIELNPAGAMVVFPNPTNNKVNVLFRNIIFNANIKVFNVTGRCVFETGNQSGQKLEIDLSNQSPGIYFIEVHDGENVWVGKVVRQ